LDFAPVIQEYVKEKQYGEQSFSVNLTLSSEQFPVKKGDFIGRAGNSGASGGPHLHFEIRDTEKQSPLYYGAHGIFPVVDQIPPRLTRLQFYSYSVQSGIPRSTMIKEVDVASTTTPIWVTDTFYVAMGAYDRMEGSNAFLALDKYQIYIDELEVYTYAKTDLPPSMGRYLNSFLQYDQRVNHNHTLLKTWVEPGNRVDNLVTSLSNGLFSLPDTLVHHLKIVLTDDSGNKSVYRYKIAKRKSEHTPCPVKGKALLWVMDNYFETEGLQLYIPFGALGKNIVFHVERAELPILPNRVFYAPIWRIGSPSEPLLKPMRIKIAAQIPEAFKEKAIVVSVSKEGVCSSAGGAWNDPFLETTTYHFGDYTVTIDTIPPTITPRFKEGADLRGTKQLSFRIGDDLSGIKSYEGFIDGEWALFEYDAKYRSLSYTFDKKRTGSGKTHRLELFVTDNCNNLATYKTTFTW
jgi:hypothetical protein